MAQIPSFMGKIFSISALAIIVFLSSLQVSITSCTKEKTIIDTLVKVQKDTLIIKDTSLSAEILTDNPWRLQEYQGVVGGSIVYYSRGGSSNTINYDQEYIVFHSDKTGAYYDPNGYSSPLTWDFANADNTKIVYTVQFPVPGPTVITWDNIRYKNGSLKFDQYWTQGDINSHTQNIRIPAAK